MSSTCVIYDYVNDVSWHKNSITHRRILGWGGEKKRKEIWENV